MKGYHGSNTPTEIKDLWSTPQFVFDFYNGIYNYGVDLCADDKNHKCDLYITEEMNALDMETTLSTLNLCGVNDRNIWCNPPYSDVTPWVDLCIELSKRLGVSVSILIPADTSVKWFRKAWDNASIVDFINGRLSFINAATGKPVNGNNKGSVVFTFGNGAGRSVTLIDRDDMKHIDTPVTVDYIDDSIN